MSIVPNTDTTLAEAQRIEYDALHKITQAKIEITKAEDTVKSADTSAGNVYAGVATEALGGGFVKAGIELFVARAEDKAGTAPVETDSTPLRTIDQDVGLSMRAPGVYNARPQSIYGGDPKGSSDLSGNVLEQVQLTKASLHVPKDTHDLVQADSKGNVSGIKAEVDDKTLSSAKFAQKLVFDQKYANQAAIDAMPTFYAQHSAGKALVMGAGAPAPNHLYNFTPKDLAGLASETAGRTDTV